MGNGRPRVKKAMKSKGRHEVMHNMVEDMAAAFYRRVNPRREQEIMDARMIQEDPNGIANLSEKVINRRFNANRFMQSLGKCDEYSEI
jgi:hypothetical protein